MKEDRLQVLQKYKVDDIQAFLRNRTSVDIPENMQEYILQLDSVARMMHSNRLSVRGAIDQLRREWPTLSVSQARAVYYDALDYYYFDDSTSAKAWDMVYADQFEALKTLAIAADNYMVAFKCMEKAHQLRTTVRESEKHEWQAPVFLINVNVKPVLPMNRNNRRKMTMKTDAVELYMNKVQALANAVDPNKLIGALGRGTGKTTGITAPRSLRVASLMPRETSIISHSSFVALMTNVIPVLLSAYRQDVKMSDGTVRPMMQEGWDFVVGEKDLPKHFQTPRYPLIEPERSIVFANGHVLRAVAVDRADSIAGASIVHGIFEEMKYSNGEKLRSRIIPAIRTSRIGAGSDAHKCHLHGGITGVSDIGRVSIGESNWFTDYEEQMDPDLIADILSLALHVNRAKVSLQKGEKKAYAQSVINKWSPLLTELRKSAVLYIRASTFINRDVLGFDYFQTQKDMLSMSEFLSSICSIGDRNRENLFFELWDEAKHTYDDGYVYRSLEKLNLKETVKIDAGYLRDYVPTDKILIGYDPGNFASMVAGQENVKENTLRIMKEFFVYPPADIPDLAQQFNAFFGPVSRNKRIDLYYDRAGNKKNAKRLHETDAKELKAALESYGWRVNLMNLGQRTIFYWEHHKLWKRLLAENERSVPRIRIDANECPNLVSAMYCCKKIPGSSPVELDKSPEKKVRIDLQAGLTPQIPSALTYLVWGKYSKFFPGLSENYNAGGEMSNFSL